MPEGMEEGFGAATGVEGVEDSCRTSPSTDSKPSKEGSMKGGR